MNSKRWKLFSGLLAIVVAAMVFMAPPALAQGQQGDAAGQRDQRGGRMLIHIAAETIGLTPQELIAELRAEEGRTIADVANKHGVNPDSIVDAVVAKVSEKLAERVENGDMTQDKADELLATVRERATEAINKPLPAKGQDQRRQRAARGLVKVAAETIGLTPQELITELRAEDGLSIADVANNHNVSPDAVIEAVMAKASAHLAERVAEGKITQEQADERLVTIREKVTEVVNSPFPHRGKDSRPGPNQSDNQ